MPTWEDAINVLRDIAVEYGEFKKPLDDEVYAVAMACWRLVSTASAEHIFDGEKLRECHSLKCIPNANRILTLPDVSFLRTGQAWRQV